MRSNVIKIIGYIFTLLAFYYIYLTFNKLDIEWEKLQELINDANILLAFLSFFIYLIVLYISAEFWSYLVHYFSGSKENKNRKLIDIYAQSNIGKYLPGNFMQLVGRNVLANKLGYTHSVILLSSIYEMAYVLFTGLLIISMIMLFNLSDISLQKGLFLSPKKIEIALIVGSLILLFSLLFFKDKFLGYIQQNNIIFKLKNSILPAMAVFLIVYLLLGVANLLLLSIFIDNISMNDYFNILFVFVLSWVVGFAMPGMPGGIGVREAVFIFLLSQKYEILIVTLIPIIFRLISILGDVSFFARYSVGRKAN